MQCRIQHNIMDIYLIRTNDLTFDNLAPYLDCVTPLRREVIERRACDSAKVNSLISELLVLSEISRRTGIAQDRIKFRKGMHGKPYIKNKDGAWLEFSLSHTNGAVIAAFSEDGEIGIDIERPDRRVSDVLYNRVLCEEERFHVTSGTDFLLAWVKKEAFLKRLGVGITRDLRGVNSLELPDTTAQSFGGFIVGISGKGAADAQMIELPVGELLKKYNI